MKTSYIIIILGIIISGSVIFAILFELPFETEHYEIKITGLKEVYLVGESYSFSYTISGYGYACADREVTYPDKNGNTVRNNIDVDCNTGTPKTEFVIDSKDEPTKTGNTGIKNPGTYNVSVMFEKSTDIEPTQAFDGFHVVEKICDDSNPKDRAQCFVDAFDSCTSSFAEFAFPTGEGDGILVTGVVESWNDCNLRVYTDHTQDRYSGDSAKTRSICDGVMINDESISFENCNNEEIPPLRFDQQYYLYKERCEIFGGWWNFEYNTCFDFSDDYDCEDMGGELVKRAYTDEQPNYSKKSDSFACDYPQIIQNSFDNDFGNIGHKQYDSNVLNCNDINPYKEYECFRDAFSNCQLAKVDLDIYTIEGSPIHTNVTITDDCKMYGIIDTTTDVHGDRGIIKTTCETLSDDQYGWSIKDCDALNYPEMQFNYEMQFYPEILECEKNGNTWVRERLECIVESENEN